MTNRKKLFIAVGVFIGSVLIISLIFILTKKSDDASNKVEDDSLKSAYVDPYSGETVYDQPSRTPESYNESITITYLGFTKLLDLGLSSAQLRYVQNDIDGFSKEKNITMKEVTIDQKTFKQTINSDSGEKSIAFTIIVNRNDNEQYKVLCTYRSISDMHTLFYTTNGELLFDSSKHDTHSSGNM